MLVGRGLLRLLVLGAVLSLLSSGARADLVDIKFGGQISSDLRYRLNGEEVPPSGAVAPFPTQQRLLKYGFSRNENLIKAQLSLGIADKVKAVADVDFVWYGYSDVNDIDSATLHERVDPYRLEAHAAYVDIYKVIPKVDLRIGRQVVVWGTADKFNPTNNLNSLDLSDPLLFGKAIANDMVRVDFNPWRDLIITAVWVPIFRPAQLPRTAPLALTQLDRPAPVQDEKARNTLGALAVANPPQQIDVYALLPPPAIENSQFGLRVAGRLLGQDVSLSYYHGRFDIPSPAWTINKPNGLVQVGVVWPREDVIGADIAGSIQKLGGIGYWVEAAVTFPQEITYGVYNDSFGGHDPITFNRSDGNIKIGYPEEKRGVVIPSTPFLKLTAGLDYSFNKYLYGNFQYVHGFIDEFGAGVASFVPSKPGDPYRIESRIGDYLVAGADLKFFNDALLIRLFGAFKLPHADELEPKFTAVIFPQVAWAVWDATELSLGAFWFIGDRNTKFGDPAAGATELFLKAKFTY